MRVSRYAWAVVLASTFASAQASDLLVAEGVLGPRWKQMARRAGMIFVGTVLNPSLAGRGVSPASPPGALPSTPLTMRVEAPIAGVRRGQILTVRFWPGVSQTLRPMNRGRHLLLFLYPASRSGLTSPVGGSLGQVELDPGGETAIASPRNLGPITGPQSRLPLAPFRFADRASLAQLERAIRRAREQ